MNLMNEGVLPPNELDDRDERREESEAQDTETIADIIAEMRGMGNYQRYSGDHARVLANRLEAAHRRERGDAAKLREALKRIVAASIVAKNANAPEWILQRMADIFAMATTALSAPPRNCDVGTAKEQAARFFALCNSNKCSSCPCRFTEKTDCALIWAQMPYEEGGAK